MKYMLLIHADAKGWSGLASWSPDDFKRMVGYMRDLDADLRASGELLHDNGLGGPGGARTVRAQADGSAVVRDGLRGDASDFLAGYWVVDVASPERAVEIATRISLTPGPGGRPVNQQVEVHAIGEPPEV
jgi:hypothetical protein